MARHQDPAAPAHSEPLVENERRPSRSDVGLAALLGLFVAVFVLWTPISKLRTHTLGAWDHLALLSPLTAVESAAEPTNYLVLDPERQMIPWALLARDELRAGRAPLWNEFNGGGIPLLGNYQSAVFSPFTLPFYVLPLGVAVLASAALKLFTLTATMFLFLRALGRSRGACTIGAIVYATSAFYAIYLLHPHVGVHALLPLVLLFVERVTWSADRPAARARAWDVVGLAIALGLMALAGHPESFAFALYVVVGYSAWRLGSAALRTRGERVRRVAVVRSGLALLGAAALGASLSAVQWLPFLEYLCHSAVALPEARSFETFTLAYWPLHLFPNLLGSAIGSRLIGGMTPSAVVSDTFNVGTCAFLLVLSAPFIVRDRSLFFVVAGLVVLAYAYDVPWIGGLLAPVFLAGTAPMWPTNVVWIVGASVGSAAVIDAVLAARSRKPWILLATLALLAVAAFVARERLFRGLAVLAEAGDVPMPDFVEAHVCTMTALALLGLAALAVLRLSARRSVRAACFVALGAAALLENTEPFRDYVPTVEDRLVLSATPALGELARELHGERCVFLTASGLYPNSNIQHDVHLISSYDAMEIREYDELRAKLFGPGGYNGRTLLASRRALDLFGVEYVATHSAWLPLDTEFTRGQRAGIPWYVLGELGLPRKPRFVELDASEPSVVQRFAPSRDGCDGLVVHFSALDVTDAPSGSLTLRDASGAVLAQRSFELGQLRRLAGERMECTLEFEQQPNSSTQSYELEIRRAPNANGKLRLFRAVGQAAEADEEADEHSTGWQLARDSRELRGRVVLDLSYGRADFVDAGEFAGLLLRRYVARVPSVHVVPAIRCCVGHEYALAAVLADDFDPQREVVLERRDEFGPLAQLDSHVDTLESGATASRYRTRCSAPVYLVTTLPFFPGWRASIDGREVEVERANAAFCAVALPAGEHELAIEYRPASFRIGKWLALASAAAIAAMLALERRRARGLA